MTCTDAQGALLPYHMGVLAPAETDQMDAHLLSCGGCLRGYLQTKRQIEAEAAAEGPSPAARARLRLAVQRRFRKSAWQRLRDLIRHPVPLYQGVFALTLALLLVTLVPPLLRAPLPAPLSVHVDRPALTPRDVRTY